MPATAASAAPITKVCEIVRLTLTPNSEAIFMSCSQARCWRPSEVAAISQLKPAISTTVTMTMMICSQVTRTSKPSRLNRTKPPSTMRPPGLGRAPCTSCT